MPHRDAGRQFGRVTAAVITEHVEPGAIVTDGRSGYNGLAKLGYVRRQLSPRAARDGSSDDGSSDDGSDDDGSDDTGPTARRAPYRRGTWLYAGYRAPAKARSSQRTSPPHFNKYVIQFNRRTSHNPGTPFLLLLEP